MSPIKATKTPGGHGGDYISQGSVKGVSHATRREISVRKLELLRAWRSNLVRLLKAGAGLDVVLDAAMRELVDELTDLIDSL
jgi:hypothetical protein